MLKKETLTILKEKNIRLDRRKGQNYLIDENIRRKIVEKANLSPNDTLLEIGAGIGTLTIPLAQNAGKVIAVEQDKRIADFLEDRLDEMGISNVKIMKADAIKMNFPKFNKIVSNLPYKISSPITFKFLEYDFDFALLMYQLEFANRMVAKPGASNYSRLSLMMHYCANVDKLFEVSNHCFFPEPKVSSAVIKLTPKKADVDEFLIKTSRALFQHKNKKVKNALLDSFHEISYMDKKDARAVVLKLDPSILGTRVVKLDPEDIRKISARLKSIIEK